jgi:hypothetical protein
MKTWVKILIGLIIVGVLGFIAVYVFVYNKPHPDYEKEKTDISIPARELYTAFKENDSIANSKYTGKVLEVIGSLSKTETPEEDLTIAIIVVEQGMYGDQGVRFTMLPEHSKNIMNYQPGQTITLKGLCTGFNSNVVIEKASIVN